MKGNVGAAVTFGDCRPSAPFSSIHLALTQKRRNIRSSRSHRVSDLACDELHRSFQSDRDQYDDVVRQHRPDFRDDVLVLRASL